MPALLAVFERTGYHWDAAPNRQLDFLADPFRPECRWGGTKHKRTSLSKRVMQPCLPLVPAMEVGKVQEMCIARPLEAARDRMGVCVVLRAVADEDAWILTSALPALIEHSAVRPLMPDRSVSSRTMVGTLVSSRSSLGL